MNLHIDWYHDEELCARIILNFRTHTVKVINLTDNIIDRPFGRKENVSWDDAFEFLEWRCFERKRQDASTILNILNLSSYNPAWIVQVTAGRIEGDKYWMKAVVNDED